MRESGDESSSMQPSAQPTSQPTNQPENLLNTGTIGVETIDCGRIHVRVAVPDGALFLRGMANSYRVEYSSEVPFDEVLSRHELEALVQQFNR